MLPHRRQLFILAVLIMLPFSVHAQNRMADFQALSDQFYTYNDKQQDADSSRYVLGQLGALLEGAQNDSLQAELQVMWSDYMTRTRELDSANYYNKEAIRLFGQANAHLRKIKYVYKQAGMSDVAGNRDEALEMAKAVHQFALEIKDTFYIMKGLCLMGSYEAIRGDHVLALEHGLAAQKYWEALPENQQKRFIPHRTLGVIYSSSGRLDDAIQAWKVVVDWYLAKENYWKACQWSNNLSLVYMEKLDTTNAMATLYQSSHYAQLSGFTYGYANAQSQLAGNYVALNRLDSAAACIARVHEAVPVIEEPAFGADFNGVLGLYYAARKDYSQGIRYSQLSFAYYRDQEMALAARQKALLLSQICRDAGRFEEAYDYLSQYTVYQDSAVNQESIEKFKELELTAEFDKQRLTDSLDVLAEQQLTELSHQQDMADERESKNLLYFALILFAVGIGFSTFAFARKRRQARLLDEKNNVIAEALHEKQVLLKEVHHRVKNNFQIVSSLLELQSKGIEDEKARELAQEGKNRVKSMAFIHQRLYQNDDLLIQFDEYVDALTKEISAMYGSSVQTNINVNNLAFDIDTAIPLGLIINELVTNAFKYGFEEGGVLDIALEKAEDDYVLTVADNGKGLPEGLDLTKARSLGLRLVRQLSKQLQGKVQYEYAGGARFSIWFKDSLGRAEQD